MGVLDDAIREHIELKRKHGAAEQDLEREKQEALGPARRGAAPAEDVDAGDEPVEADQVEAEAAEPTSDSDSDLAADIFSAEPAQPVESEQPAASHEEPAADATDYEEPSAHDPLPEPPPGETPTRGFAAVDEPPAQDHSEDRAAKDDDEQGEDVLEETPEFLQEAPEHDRLWFEQKPPRDFDFDDEK